MIETKINLDSKLINFSEIPIQSDWSFSDKTIKDTGYISHGYYTYPAKFIPQLASRLIKENSEKGDIIIDSYMGSATTIVEAIVNERIGIGVDINEVAYLLAKVKTTPINPEELNNEFNNICLSLDSRLNGQFNFYLEKAKRIIPNNERIDYWFKKEQKEKLSIIFCRIKEIENMDIRDFFYVVFAQILKSTSIWLQKSVKPTRDFNKKDFEPLQLFLNQAKKLLKKNGEFDKILCEKVKKNINKYRIVECSDSRKIPCDNEEASLIVSSPPYVTSYEYADLHQLPSLWFGYLEELSTFRKKFIGSSCRERNKIELKSKIAEKILCELGNNKKEKEVENYFADMLESFIEMKRVLKKGGRACIVIGNTQFNGVDILNAEVFQEQFKNIGFKTNKIIHREISSKMLPTTRDEKNGRFAKTTINNKLVHPKEYIIIVEK